MAIAATDEATPRKPLRLWPGVVLVTLQCLGRFVIPLLVPEALIYGVIGSLVFGLGILLWWVFFSQAPRRILPRTDIHLFLESHPALRTSQSLLFALLLVPVLAHAQADPTSRSSNQPVEPYRIAGNLYYVGASDVTSYLITTPTGNIVLDGGFAETAPMIEANIQKLGFKVEDVKVLLSTHAHFDHAGGLAGLKQRTGAPLHAGAADADLLARGGKGDFAFGDKLQFPPVQVDRPVHDGDRVSLGGTTLTAHATPGHTRGCTSWSMQVEEGGKRYDVVFVGSTTINPGVHLAGKPSYPGIAEDYARSFQALKGLPCDIFLAAHASFYGGLKKADRLKKGGGVNPFVDPQGYREFLAWTEKAYQEQLAKETAAAAKGPERKGAA